MSRIIGLENEGLKENVIDDVLDVRSNVIKGETVEGVVR